MAGFLAMLKEHNDLANQHDLIAEGLITKVHQPLNNAMKELKEARRKVLLFGRNWLTSHSLSSQCSVLYKS